VQGSTHGARRALGSIREWGPALAALAGVVLYYEIGNRLFAPSFATASRHALTLWHLEQRWHLAWEPSIQHAVQSVQVSGIPWLMNLLVLIYVGPHFLLTLGMFGWSWWRRPGRFAEVRNVFVAFTVLAFGFQWLWPMAPPWQTPETGMAYSLRVLPVDGSNPTIQGLTNPLAAFPSVHTGWSFLCAYFLVRLTAGRSRYLWWLYPTTIIVAILATGNHFILDIVGVLPFLWAAFMIDAAIRRPDPEAQNTPPLHVHGPADAAMSARWQGLAHLGAQPRKLSPVRNFWSVIRLAEDYLLSVPPAMVRVSARLRRYPKPFRREWITARDGTRLCAWVGLQPKHAPALVIVPGLFTSKDNHVVRRRALRVYREWGYHVLTLDMRGNGQSDRVPSTAGWKEADDLLDVVRHLRGMAQVDGVAVYAESLAATGAVVAARLAGERGEPFADLGVVAVSALHDPAEAIRVYSDPPPGPLRPFAKFYTFLLRRSGQPGIHTFGQYHEASSRQYGVTPEEASRRSQALTPGMRLTGPLLVVHSRDDDLVPADQVLRRLAIARQTRGLAVWVLSWGHHCVHELADREWFWAVLDGFIGPKREQSTGKGIGTRTGTLEPLAQQA
jgi:pimeloyl-ACP methyl ester carboxylesterase